MGEIIRSVAMAPTLDSHVYLRTRKVALTMTDAERSAVEAGFKQAIADASMLPEDRYEAENALAQLYIYRDRNAEAAKVYSDAAQSFAAIDKTIESVWLISGELYAKAQLYRDAEHAFRSAIAKAPDDSQPYADLITLVLTPRKRLDQAERLPDQILASGGDSGPVLVAVGLARQVSGEQPSR